MRNGKAAWKERDSRKKCEIWAGQARNSGIGLCGVDWRGVCSNIVSNKVHSVHSVDLWKIYIYRASRAVSSKLHDVAGFRCVIWVVKLANAISWICECLYNSWSFLLFSCLCELRSKCRRFYEPQLTISINYQSAANNERSQFKDQLVRCKYVDVLIQFSRLSFFISLTAR